jgi:hypothetical protein
MKFEISVDTETKAVSCKKDGQEVKANFGSIYFDKSTTNYKYDEKEYSEDNDMCSIYFGTKTADASTRESGGWSMGSSSVKEMAEKISAAIDRTMENIKASSVIASFLKRK